MQSAQPQSANDHSGIKLTMEIKRITRGFAINRIRKIPQITLQTIQKQGAILPHVAIDLEQHILF